ncbi:MAG: hypothetical protein AAFO72_11000 [Pseudomonadota bacterium]
MCAKHILCTLAILIIANAAQATEHNVPADIAISCNPHGAIVTTADGSTYYLGKSCDASQPGVGEGRWWFAASAFIIEINGQAVRFANELSCDVPYCRP